MSQPTDEPGPSLIPPDLLAKVNPPTSEPDDGTEATPRGPEATDGPLSPSSTPQIKVPKT